MELSQAPDMKGVHTPWLISLHQIKKNKHARHFCERQLPWLIDLIWDITDTNEKKIEQDEIASFNSVKLREFQLGQWLALSITAEKVTKTDYASIAGDQTEEDQLICKDCITNSDLLFHCYHLSAQEMRQIYTLVKARREQPDQEQPVQIVKRIAPCPLDISSFQDPSPRLKSQKKIWNSMEIALLKGSLPNPQSFILHRDYESIQARFSDMQPFIRRTVQKRLMRRFELFVKFRGTKLRDMIISQLLKNVAQESRLLVFLESPIGRYLFIGNDIIYKRKKGKEIDLYDMQMRYVHYLINYSWGDKTLKSLLDLKRKIE